MTDIARTPEISPTKAIQGIINAKHVDGTQFYKVRYEGKENDEWVGADQRVASNAVAEFCHGEMHPNDLGVGGGLAGAPRAAKRAKTMPSDYSANKTALASATGVSA